MNTTREEVMHYTALISGFCALSAGYCAEINMPGLAWAFGIISGCTLLACATAYLHTTKG